MYKWRKSGGKFFSFFWKIPERFLSRVKLFFFNFHSFIHSLAFCLFVSFFVLCARARSIIHVFFLVDSCIHLNTIEGWEDGRKVGGEKIVPGNLITTRPSRHGGVYIVNLFFLLFYLSLSVSFNLFSLFVSLSLSFSPSPSARVIHTEY